jgi:drug/metabolite transporter (DMT)-like permease
MTLSPQKNVQSGLLMMVGAMLFIPLSDALAKYLTSDMSSGQIACGRFFFQALILLPFVLKSGEIKPRGPIWKHAALGIFLSFSALLFFTSLKVLPLANAIAIFFIEPFILIVLSAIILREKVGWRRILAVSVGFVGALIIIQPSYAIFGLSALLPACAATTFALYLITSRNMTSQSSAVAMQFSTGIFGFLFLSLCLGFGYGTETDFLTPSTPDLFEFSLLMSIGVIATLSHLLIINSVKRVGTAMIAPFQYIEIVSATLFGLLFFGDFPGSTTWLGIALIIGSGLYVFYREQQLAKT